MTFDAVATVVAYLTWSDYSGSFLRLSTVRLRLPDLDWRC